MSEKHPDGQEKPKFNIHRRIVSYGLMLSLAAIAYGVVMSTRYQVILSERHFAVLRYDRWTGQVTLMDEGRGWEKF